MPGPRSVTVSTDGLSIGTTARYPIYSVDGTLLFPSGVLISEGIKEGLKAQDHHQVVLHPDDARDCQAPPATSQTAPAALLQPFGNFVAENSQFAHLKTEVDTLVNSVSLAAENSGPPVRDTLVSPGCVAYDAAQRDRLTQQFEGAADLVNTMVTGLLNGSSEDSKKLAAVATNYVTELTQDSGHVVALSTELAQDPQVTERSVRISVLGMAIGIQLGLDAANAHTIGVCGLVQDWGMFRLPERLRDPKEPLTQADWGEVMSHPIHTVDLLRDVAGIPELVRLICYQVHERMDGSGYPNGRQGDQIHLFAWILSLADAYLAITSNIRGRPALVPYDAMVYVLHQSQLGRLDDQVVRALVSVLSMYPVGSHVQLDDGSEARVIRASGENYTSPIVQQVVDAEGVRIDGPHSARIVDLSHGGARVVRPLKTPGHKEMRVERELMDELDWDGPDA